jgi:DNA-binding transcriptional LysR family regulator
MNVGMLATLAAIVDRGSFAAAAREVGCTPSAVSLQVKQLEAYFGQLLFDRSARTAKPTPFALEAVTVARDFSHRLEALRARPSVKVSGRVRLGAIASVQTSALPPALKLLRDRHPALQVEVSLNDSDPLIADLKAGRIDAAVLVRPQSGGSSRLAWQNLARQPFVMLVPPGTPATTPQELLQRFDLIRYDTSLTGGRIAARYVRQVFPAARCSMEVRSIDAIVAMVSAGLGVSIVPRPRKALMAAHNVREVRLGKAGPTRQIAFARRRADWGHRNIDAVFKVFAAVHADGEG